MEEAGTEIVELRGAGQWERWSERMAGQTHDSVRT